MAISRRLIALILSAFWLLLISCRVHSQVTDDPIFRLQLPSPLSPEIISQYGNDQLSAHLARLIETPKLPARDALADTLAIRDYAAQGNQIELEIDAASAAVIILARLNEVEHINRLVNTYLPQAINRDLPVPASRIYRGLLRVALLEGNEKRRVVIKRQLLGLLEKGLPARDEGLILLSLGTSDFFARQYFSSLQHLRRAQDVFARHELLNDKDRVLSILAIANSRLGNKQRAIDIQLEIADRMRLGEKSLNWSIIDFNIGKAYLSLGENQAASLYLLSSRDIAQEFDDPSGVAYANDLLARIALQEQKFAMASALASGAAETFASLDNTERLLSSLITYASAELHLGNTAIAQQQWLKITQLNEQQTNASLIADIIELRALFAEKRGDFQQAIALYKQYYQAVIDYKEEAQTNVVSQLMSEISDDAQQTDNRYLIQQNALNQATIEKQKQQQTIFYLLFALAVLIVLAISTLIVLQWRKANNMRELALTDELTGAPNRRACMRAAKLAFNQAAAGHYSLVVAAIDLDRFKSINDRFGHDVGDRVLVLFANAVRSVLREQDTFGRLGGEEWLLIFPRADLMHVDTIFERLRSAYQELGQEVPVPEHELTFSMGAVSSLDNFANVDNMLSQADKLVYTAKSKGRNRLEINQLANINTL
ncbi:GGDEF domain-containing protein [Alteromonas sp. ASW11-36]|uniref:diguanylate cyclase n=1 Tax=Alteromonas arenosi TaxID=3055817 RepID=A0ABT7SUU6_9ALTE|nr:GGDEF domain-containing protein [Alteromonas sp. ASW11-36]MDM7859953.1 GGDEF domain-containing protein [Alteromonas sp. ASW11-36]